MAAPTQPADRGLAFSERRSSAATKGGSAKRGAKRGAQKKNEKSPRPKREEEKEQESVLSGRMVAAFALVVAMAVVPLSPLGQLIEKEAPRTTAREHWKVGETSTVHLTLTTADYEKLGCADPRVIEGSHCAYKSKEERFPQKEGAPKDDNKRNILQPYRTTDQQLMLLSGLWAQPAVAMRLHEEPARGVSDSKLSRFVVSCDVRFLEEWENPLIRWNKRDKFAQQGKAMVAEPLKCEVLEEHQSKKSR